MIHVRVIRDLRTLETLTPAWRALLDRAESPEPVLTPTWMLAWWREFGDADGRDLRVAAAFDGAELVGLLPMARRWVRHRGAIPTRRLETLATGEAEADEIGSDYVGALTLRDAGSSVAKALARAVIFGDLGEWDELRMPSLNGEDGFARVFCEALRAAGAAVSVRPTGLSPYIPLPGAWEDYLQALGASSRYLVTRSLRELEAWAGEGGFRVHRATTANDLDEGMRALRGLHAERWTSAGRAGVFASERFVRFHEDVMPRYLRGADGVSLDLAWLEARGEPIAAAYNLVYRRKVYFYQSGRKVDLPKALRPGIAMHALAIRRAIDAGMREYDFLAGASRYKRELALASRPIVELRAVAPHLRARAVDLLRTVTESAIDRLRSVRSSASSTGVLRAVRDRGQRGSDSAGAPRSE
jgi:CelD/BcsL family acetyltransferase involved in cellulose biosynthesis